MDFNGNNSESDLNSNTDNDGGGNVVVGITKVRFNSSTDALVSNGGLWDDGNIRIGWDASTITEFMMLTAPTSGGLQIHSQRTNFDTDNYVTQVNYKFDLQNCPSNDVISFWVHAMDDASYPSYYGTVFNISGSYGQAQLTIQTF